MSKVRINDLAKELEVKSRAILDILQELGIAGVKTHSSSLEGDEADKVRAHFEQDSRSAAQAASASGRHGAQAIVPKIDLSRISKPGDVMKAILAKKKEEEEEARHARVVAKPAAPPQPAKPVVHAAPAVHAAPP
ncbi:MAG: translation initiation factor IF-2 N-terminal domain-containing protein, partial [Terracidiphilus sp.]